jgi:hypothetical protein
MTAASGIVVLVLDAQSAWYCDETAGCQKVINYNLSSSGTMAAGIQQNVSESSISCPRTGFLNSSPGDLQVGEGLGSHKKHKDYKLNSGLSKVRLQTASLATIGNPWHPTVQVHSNGKMSSATLRRKWGMSACNNVHILVSVSARSSEK